MKEKTTSYYHKGCGGLLEPVNDGQGNRFKCFACMKKGDLNFNIVEELAFKKFYKYLVSLEESLNNEVGDLYKRFQAAEKKESVERVRFKMKDFIGQRKQVRFFLTGIERGLNLNKIKQVFDDGKF